MKKYVVAASDGRYVSQAKDRTEAMQTATRNCSRRRANVLSVCELTTEMQMLHALVIHELSRRRQLLALSKLVDVPPVELEEYVAAKADEPGMLSITDHERLTGMLVSLKGEEI